LELSVTTLITYLVGPRVPSQLLRAHRLRFALPTLFFVAARVLLLVCIFLPFWHMELDAPQYPDGLSLTAYVNHLQGDVKEIDALNHYIGMRPLEQAAAFEQAASIWLIIAMVLLVEGAAVVHTKWAVLLALPAILFPAGFLLDLQFWLNTFGQNLDPSAALSNSVKPFTPTLLGEGGIGQFYTYAQVGTGFWLAVTSSLLTVIGFVFHRRAYRPLVEPALAPFVPEVA
jgi:hypothetical protein